MADHAWTLEVPYGKLCDLVSHAQHQREYPVGSTPYMESSATIRALATLFSDGYGLPGYNDAYYEIQRMAADPDRTAGDIVISLLRQYHGLAETT